MKSGKKTVMKRDQMTENPPWALDSLEAGTQYNVTGREKVGTFSGDLIEITFTTDEDSEY